MRSTDPPPVRLSICVSERALTAPDPTKFFGGELGAQATFNDETERYIVNGAHDASRLRDLLDTFIDKFVLCPACKNPETELIITKDEHILRDCKACGQRGNLDMKHKLTTFILKNPPKSATKGAGKKGKKATAGADSLPSGGAGSDGESDDELTKKIEAGAAQVLSTEEAAALIMARENDNDWSIDTSKEAVAARISELDSKLQSSLILDDEDEDSMGGQYDVFGEWVRENKDTVTDGEIYKKAEELGLAKKHKVLIVLVQALFTENIVKEIPSHVGLFTKVRRLRVRSELTTTAHHVGEAPKVAPGRHRASRWRDPPRAHQDRHPQNSHGLLPGRHPRGGDRDPLGHPRLQEGALDSSPRRADTGAVRRQGGFEEGAQGGGPLRQVARRGFGRRERRRGVIAPRSCPLACSLHFISLLRSIWSLVSRRSRGPCLSTRLPASQRADGREVIWSQTKGQLARAVRIWRPRLPSTRSVPVVDPLPPPSPSPARPFMPASGATYSPFIPRPSSRSRSSSPPYAEPDRDWVDVLSPSELGLPLHKNSPIMSNTNSNIQVVDPTSSRRRGAPETVTTRQEEEEDSNGKGDKDKEWPTGIGMESRFPPAPVQNDARERREKYDRLIPASKGPRTLVRLDLSSSSAVLTDGQMSMVRDTGRELAPYAPLIAYTILSLFTRLYKIGHADSVVWDEVRLLPRRCFPR